MTGSPHKWFAFISDGNCAPMAREVLYVSLYLRYRFPNLKEKYEMLKLYTKAQMLMASLKDESGQDLIEYCIVAAVVVLAAGAASPGLTTAIQAAVTRLTTAIG